MDTDKGIPERRAKAVVEDEDGSLVVRSITYFLNNEATPDETDGASDFTNYYDTVETRFAPSVTKKLTGDTPPGREGIYLQNSRRMEQRSSRERPCQIRRRQR